MTPSCGRSRATWPRVYRSSEQPRSKSRRSSECGGRSRTSHQVTFERAFFFFRAMILVLLDLVCCPLAVEAQVRPIPEPNESCKCRFAPETEGAGTESDKGRFSLTFVELIRRHLDSSTPAGLNSLPENVFACNSVFESPDAIESRSRALSFFSSVLPFLSRQPTVTTVV